MEVRRQHLGGSTEPLADPLRDGWARYLAFTSDVGEAFKHYASRRLYLGSYAVVALYGVVDTADKGRRAYDRVLQARQPSQRQPVPAPTRGGLSLPLPSAAAAAAAMASACTACLPPAAAYVPAASSASEQQSVAVPVAAAVLDTALWHGVASLAIPAVLVNRTVWATRQLMAQPLAVARLHPRLRQLAPPAAGLAFIPLAVHHIDEAVTRWFEAHLRPHLPKEAFPASTSTSAAAATPSNH